MIARLVAFGVLLSLCGAFVGCRRSSESSAPHSPTMPAPGVPKTPRARTSDEVREAYITAMDEKDFATMAALSDVPWFDTDRHLIRDRDALPKAIERAVAQMPAAEKRRVETVAYKTVREKIEIEADRKLLDEVFGEDGWLVLVENEGRMSQSRVIIIRVKDGLARVVGGPLKDNQLVPHNMIPEPVQRLFAKAESFELYSLSPSLGLEGVKDSPEKDKLHGYEILGRTEVKSVEDRKRLTDALLRAAEDATSVAACFNPRHGIRMKAGADTVDLVICFECSSINVYVNGKKQKQFLTTNDPQKTFDDVLKAAGVKLPKQANE
ncbi:MAG: hypothetical protein K8U57_39385 [Planctomycetes bacterium]|nr:hypothetical protein [Planctomycetota bacterium]